MTINETKNLLAREGFCNIIVKTSFLEFCCEKTPCQIHDKPDMIDPYREDYYLDKLKF